MAPGGFEDMLRFESVLLLAGALLFAENIGTCVADDASKVDAKALNAFRAAAEYLQSLDRFSVSMQSTMRAELVGEIKQDIGSDYKLIFERPNRFAITLQNGETGASMISDGKQQVTYLPRKKKYSVQDAELSFAAVASGRSLVAQEIHWEVFAYFFLLFEPPDEFEKDIVHAENLGVERLGYVAVDHLRIGIDDTQCDYWVEKADKPCVRKIVPDLRRAFDGTGSAGVKLEAVALFDAWRAEPRLPVEAFRFVPPPGAEKVESVVKALKSDKNHCLLGKPAPDFVANGLDGKPVHLADLKGKGVIVIQFWVAHKPFAELMAKLADITADHKGESLTFVAINLGEDAAGVRTFLKQNKLDLLVVLDAEGKIAREYSDAGEDGMPLIFIVGKDGTVQAVHGSLPFDENDEKRMRREIDMLLEGKMPTVEQSKPDPDDGGVPDGPTLIFPLGSNRAP